MATKRPATKKAAVRAVRAKRSKGRMTVQEAGRKGGELGGRKGGETTRKRYGHEFYEEIGRKGGSRVRALIAAGQKAMSKARGRRK